MYKVHIEHDDTKRRGGAYKIAIRKTDGTMVGVPARLLTMDEAVRMQQAVKHAFGYGLSAGRKQMESYLYNVYTGEAENVVNEEGPYVQVVG